MNDPAAAMPDPFLAEYGPFQAEVRDFVRAHLPAAIARKQAAHIPLDRAELTEWTRILHARGWGAPHWPQEWGGTGWSALKRQVFVDTMQSEGAPDTLSFGTAMVGPVLCAFGNQSQQRRFLPRILTLEDWWCQGFSEPGAGSDLASLRTMARRAGDAYIVNGHKTWTTWAQHADWMFCLVRTDPEAARPQTGISFLLIDMTSPGITLRPIRTIDGDREVNDVFLDDVEVPRENLVGQENAGWDYAKFLLSHERSGIARIGHSRSLLRRLRSHLGSAPPQRLEDRLIRLEVALRALEVAQMRLLAGEPALAKAGASMLKLRGSEIQQDIARLMLDLAGTGAPDAPSALPSVDPPEPPDWADTAASTFFNWRKLSIYGGSNEIQRSLIARAVLNH